jgi:MscS family membrane protein
MGFLQVAHSGNYKSAAQYFERVISRHPVDQEQIAQKLKVLMDRAYVGNLSRLSDNPEGTPEEGLLPHQERAGRLEVDQSSMDLILVRVNDPDFGQIWLFSFKTLTDVDDLYDQIQIRPIESRIPESLVRNSWLGMPLWQWLALLLLIPAAMICAWVLIKIFGLIGALFASARTRSLHYQFRPAVSAPLILILATAINGIVAYNLNLPLLDRHYYALGIGVILILGVTWLTIRIIEWLAQRLRRRAFLAGHAGAGSLMLLAQRLFKVLIIVAGVLAVLTVLGFNTTTALAGVGIGGIAIAFAAQKTLENVLGGVSLLSDDAIRIGEVYRFGTTIGTVEDISLRSTRVRTLERVGLSIPNSTLATMNLENLSERDKFLLNDTIGLRYETNHDQLVFLLGELRRLLYAHPKIEPQSARVRFSGFGGSSLNLEIFCYVRTTDAAEFFAIREDVFLRVMEAVRSSGSSFSVPSRAVYFSRDRGLDPQKTEAARQTVKQWHEGKMVPFPDLSAAEIQRLRGTLAYPQPDSILLSEDREGGPTVAAGK